MLIHIFLCFFLSITKSLFSSSTELFALLWTFVHKPVLHHKPQTIRIIQYSVPLFYRSILALLLLLIVQCCLALFQCFCHISFHSRECLHIYSQFPAVRFFSWKFIFVSASLFAIAQVFVSAIIWNNALLLAVSSQQH